MTLQTIVRITDRCQGTSVCDRCTIPLYLSEWKGVTVFYSTSPKIAQGFLCVRCAMSKTMHRKVLATEQDFDDFVNKGTSKEI